MSDKKKTVLIVDDDKKVIEKLLTFLRSRRSYEPIATANPTIVEKVLDTYQVELLICDLRMERMSGYDIIKMIRSKNLNIPFIIITAYLKDEFPRLQQLGVSKEDVIEKPFQDPLQVEALINRKLNITAIPGASSAPTVFVDNNAQVLIVDDEQELAEIFSQSLQEEGYKVTSFGNGRQALDHLKTKANEFHVAVIDMALPGLLGHELIKEMLKLNPKIKVIPISAKYADEMKDKLQTIGFDPEKLVTKPFDLIEMMDEIKEYAKAAGVYREH